jgi:hypothetical protein
MIIDATVMSAKWEIDDGKINFVSYIPALASTAGMIMYVG